MEKIEVICRKHGPFWVFPKHHLIQNNGGCNPCASNKKLTTEEFIQRAIITHGNKFDYSLSIYKDNTTKIKIICPIHGIFEQSAANHFRYGCNECSGKVSKTVEKFIVDANIAHNFKYDYSKVIYKNAHEKVEIICPKHGAFWQSPTNHTHSKCPRGCNKCSKRISKNEFLWLSLLKIPNDKEHRNVFIKTINNKYYVDGFDPNTNICYEFNGDYYHGNLNIYNKDDINLDVKKTYGELWDRTLSKRKDLEEHGYKVISIWETDFIREYNQLCKIIIDFKFAQIQTENTNLLAELKSLLSFKQQGVEFTPAYQNGWNGIICLLDKKGYFYSGLVPLVKSYLTKNNYDFVEIDKRAFNINQELDVSSNLSKIKLVPRDYQLSVVDEILKNQRGIVRAVTGCGKSLMMALATAKFNDTTIIYVIGLDLLKQFHDLFSSIFNEEIGYIGNGICNIKRINIVSLWTAGRVIKIDKKILNDLQEESQEEKDVNQLQQQQIIELLKNSNIHFFDECHTVSNNTCKQLYKIINPKRIFGFSGTPFRGDNTELLIKGILGEQITDISAAKLISNGVLVQPIIKFVATPKQSNIGNTYQEVYKNYIVENDTRNELIIQQTKFLLEKKYTPLVLFKQIKHGKILSKMMDRENIKYEMLNGNDSLERRTEVKQLLIDKKINVILASTIFDIGIDLPMLNGLILAGGGTSYVRALQRIGRVIRGFPGKKVAAIVDFYDQCKFLKNHSRTRYNIYSSEKGFKVIRCPEMK